MVRHGPPSSPECTSDLERDLDDDLDSIWSSFFTSTGIYQIMVVENKRFP